MPRLRLIFGLLGLTLLATAAIPVAAADLAVLRNGFEIRHERREQIGGITRLYVGNSAESGFVDVETEQITSFEPAPPLPAPPEIASAAGVKQTIDVQRLVAAASDKHQVDPDLIASVIRAESGFNPRAVSRKGAQGLMQLMPGTASRLGVADAFAPEVNVDAGTRYLRDLLVMYDNDVVKALAAYNAGPHRVEQYRGVPPYRETRAYVARIVRDFNRKKLAGQKTPSAPPVHTASASNKRKPLTVQKSAVPAPPANADGQ